MFELKGSDGRFLNDKIVDLTQYEKQKNQFGELPYLLVRLMAYFFRLLVFVISSQFHANWTRLIW